MDCCSEERLLAHVGSAEYSLGVTSTVAVCFLCLFAIAFTCVESVYKTFPDNRPFSIACRRISSNICSAM